MLRNYAESRNGFRQHDRTGLVAIQTDISALQGTMVNEMGLSRQDSQLSGSADELDKFRTHIINHFHRDEGAIVQLAHQIDSILQFIARSKLSREEKTVYAEILANSLSLSELGLVFFVAQLEGFQELTQALQDFGFLRNLPQSYANRWSCVSRLGSGAFSRHP
jgi:hypothetical protein